MNTALTRLNAVFAFSLSALAALTFLCFLSMIMKDRRSEAGISTLPVTVDLALERMATGPEKKEHATVKFSIETDDDDALLWSSKEHIYSTCVVINEVQKLPFPTPENLSSLFDWNTKQLFVMLIAHYQTDKNNVNQVVLWDKIIKREDPAAISIRNAVSEYELFDDGYGLRGNSNLTLVMSWNVIPQAGLLPLIKSGSYQTSFSNQYSSPPPSRHHRM